MKKNLMCDCGHTQDRHGQSVCLVASCDCRKGKVEIEIHALAARLAEAERLLKLAYEDMFVFCIEDQNHKSVTDAIAAFLAASPLR